MSYLRNSSPRSEITTNRLQAGTSKARGSRLDSSSNCSASSKVKQLPLSQSVHDLRSAEVELTNEGQRPLVRGKRYRQLADMGTERPNSEQVSNERSILRNYLTVPTTSTISSRSNTHSISSQESTEYHDASSRKPPEPLKDFLTKNRKRPMKGWHERFFSLGTGCLSYAKNESSLTRGRSKTRIDLANTNVKYEADKLRILIDTSAYVCQLKFDDPDKFQKWMIAIKEHRSYDQFQSALSSTGRSSGIKPVSSVSSNVGGDIIMSTSSCASFPTTPEGPDGSKTLKQQQQRLSNEQLEAMEKLVLRLESIYFDLQNAESLLSDSTEMDNSSPTRSLFLSPLPYNSYDVGSNRTNHSRVSSISSMTSLYTAVQATPTIVAEHHSNQMNGSSDKKATSVISNVTNFNKLARQFIEEAKAAISVVQQMHQGLNSAMTNGKNFIPILTTNSKPERSPNIRIESDSEFEGSGVENSEDSNSDDMPVLNESDMNILDMKGVVLRTPEQVAGRRTTLPAQQTTPSTISLLAIIKNNIGRELSKPRLPAIVNEPLSVLQNLCEDMEYSNLLDLASEMKDRTQRMLYVATFIITTFTSKAQRKAIKSFSPLLGETFECIRPEKKWRFLAEQVRLNPPTSAVHCESKLWIFKEEYSVKYKFPTKSLEVNGFGECQIFFPKFREIYTWSTATTSTTNITSLTVRMLNHIENIFIHCSNGVTGNIHFSKEKMEKVYSPFGNFFRSLKLKTRLELADEKWVYTEEPHVERRKEILKKHPEIRTIMGPDPIIAVYVTLEVLAQFGTAYLISIYNPGWIVWLISCYFISATLNHSLGSAIHEIGHNLAFGHKYGWANRILSIVCNLPMIIPVAISYKKYHHEHHRWLGHEDLDVDVPMRCECYLFQSRPLRFVWILLNPLFYAVRPFFKSPRPLTAWEVINLVVQSAFDVIAWHLLGNYAFAYLLMGTIFGFGPHPMAGHVISEHYLFADNFATHSYYGILNIPLYNVGYHVEHHDFPYIPFTRLHKLKEMAPEYYDHLPYHKSLCRVMWDFVFLPDSGPGARSVTPTVTTRPDLYEKIPHFDLSSSLTYPEGAKKVN